VHVAAKWAEVVSQVCPILCPVAICQHLYHHAENERKDRMNTGLLMDELERIDCNRTETSD
jgi:hypothetical protein